MMSHPIMLNRADGDISPDEASIALRLKISSDVLGTGAFARVLRAELDGKVVALKALLPQWCDPEDARCRAYQQHFIKEGRFLARTKHTHIVSCLGMVQLPPGHPGLPSGYKYPAWGMLLELSKEGSISKKVCKQMVESFSRVYTDREALSWMIDIASGLLHLHTLPEPVVHRDLKLENMLLVKEATTEGGTKLVAKLADFGLHVVLTKAYPRGMVLRQRSGSFTNVVVTNSTASRMPSFRRVSMGLAVPAVAGNRPGDDDDIIKEDDSDDERELAGLAARLVPSPRNGSTLAAVASPSVPQNVDRSPQRACSNKLDDSCEGSDNGTTPVAGAVEALPTGKSPVAAQQPNSPLPPRRPMRASDGAAGLSVPTGAGAGYSPSLQNQQRRMRASDGALGLVTASKRGASTGHTAGDIGGSDAAEGPPPLRRQSNYNMIFSFERPSAVAHVIQRALASKYEVAYQLTGETGSAMYMSPEVQRHEPYNEKTDVYSFGVMLYEVFSRTMMVMSAAAADPEAYAARVANGYRPDRPLAMDMELFDLIAWCWKQEPNERPQMNDVLECLSVLKAKMDEAAATGKSGGADSAGCSCAIS